MTAQVSCIILGHTMLCYNEVMTAMWIMQKEYRDMRKHSFNLIS